MGCADTDLALRRCQPAGLWVVRQGEEKRVVVGHKLLDGLDVLTMNDVAFAAQHGDGVDVGGLGDEELAHPQHPVVQPRPFGLLKIVV